MHEKLEIRADGEVRVDDLPVGTIKMDEILARRSVGVWFPESPQDLMSDLNDAMCELEEECAERDDEISDLQNQILDAVSLLTGIQMSLEGDEGMKLKLQDVIDALK